MQGRRKVKGKDRGVCNKWGILVGLFPFVFLLFCGASFAYVAASIMSSTRAAGQNSWIFNESQPLQQRIYERLYRLLGQEAEVMKNNMQLKNAAGWNPLFLFKINTSLCKTKCCPEKIVLLLFMCHLNLDSFRKQTDIKHHQTLLCNSSKDSASAAWFPLLCTLIIITNGTCRFETPSLTWY